MSGDPNFPQTLTAQKDAGTLFDTYTTAKSVILASEILPLPANFMAKGRKLKVRAAGALSNIVTTPGTIEFQVKIGSVVAWTSGAIQLNATAHTLLPWELEVVLRVAAEGASTSAVLRGIGRLVGVHFTRTAGQTDNANTPGAFMVPATAPADGTGWDSTVDQRLDFWAGFSISNAGNGIRVDDYEVDLLR